MARTNIQTSELGSRSTPRFILHFVPASSSWLNLVERWFGELTTKRIRRDSFASVDDLKKAIAESLEAWNEEPRPVRIDGNGRSDSTEALSLSPDP